MPKYIISVECEKCNHTTDFEWKPKFETICEKCGYKINYCKQAIDGKVRTSDGKLIKMFNKQQKKRGRK